MDLLELQQRANVIVKRVNDYEDALAKVTMDETELLNQHKYADTFCLRPTLKLLFGKNLDEKLNRTLDNDIDLQLFSSSAPANNTKFSLIHGDTATFSSDTHEFIQNIDMINNHNMLQLDVQENRLVDRSTRIRQGINYSYSSTISDALVTESQIANIFKWNTTSDTIIPNNVRTVNRQVPGIVCYYLGNDYNSIYTATIPYVSGTSNINTVNYGNPPYYGAYYTKDIETSQVGESMQAECCRIFLPGMNYTRGKLESPQQIWQPDVEISLDNNGYNWQGQAIYHELVYKDLRKSCIDAGLDFTPAHDSIPDNDPQGLALRLALSKQKDYYYKRPWFTELDNVNETPKLVADNMQFVKGSIYEKASFVTLTDNMSVDGTTGSITGFKYTSDAAWNIKISNLVEALPETTQYKIHLDFIYKTNNTKNGFLFWIQGLGALFVSDIKHLKIYRQSDASWPELTTYSIADNSHFVCDVTINVSNNVITNWTMDIDYRDGTKFSKTYSESINLTNLTNLDIDAGGNLSSFNGADSYISITTGEKDTLYFTTQTGEKLIELNDADFYNNYKLDYKTYKGL